jgi:hypothetical protein
MVKRQRQTIILTASDYCLSLSFDHCFVLLRLTSSDYCLSLSFDHCFVLLRFGQKTETNNNQKTLILRGQNNGQKTETNNNQKPLILGGQNNGQKTETNNNQKTLILGGQNNGRSAQSLFSVKCIVNYCLSLSFDHCFVLLRLTSSMIENRGCHYDKRSISVDIYGMCNCCWNVVTYKWKVHNGKIEISHELSFLLSISSCICGEHYFKYNKIFVINVVTNLRI